MKHFFSTLLICLCFTTFGWCTTFHPVRLTVEYKENPNGIDAINPRLGWWIDANQHNIHQAAYHIQVFNSRHVSQSTKHLVWDSGKRYSPANLSVAYGGQALASSHKYYWRVRIWDQNGKVSRWSDLSEFGTGIFREQEWDKAQWIAYEVLEDSMKVIPGIHGTGEGLSNKSQKRAINPYFRKSFPVKKTIAQAAVHVSGLGQYELYLNGKKVSADFLSPGWTNYEKRCLYNSYDVTNELRQGYNVLGSIVGNGFFYINRERYRKLVSGYGYPMLRMILNIRYTDGTTDQIVTDNSWKAAPSPITYSSIYGGEDYDARLEQQGWNLSSFTAVGWKNVLIAKGPGGRMAAQVEHPVQIMDTIPVKNIANPAKGISIYDFGQNASGIVSIKVKGKRGDKIKITPSELLTDKGLITQKSSGENFYFEYTLKGEEEEEWKPRFTYYGFRYAMVEGGIVTSIQHLHTRNSAPSVGTFSSSNNLFNKIYYLIDWSLRSNIVSVSTDCPHREKLGWLEQAHLMGESLRHNYDVFHLYNKIVDDIIEAQLPNGMVPSIAPEFVEFHGPFRDDPGYSSAAVILPWYLYKWYGDTEVLKKAYPMMKRYVAYLTSKANAGIISYGLGDWLDIGPNEPGISQLTPVALTATAFYYQDIVLLSKMADILGKPGDSKYYEKMAEAVKSSFNDKFYDEQNAVYGSGSQTSFSMPLYLHLVPEAHRKRVFNNLRDSILAGNKMITAGDIGHRFLVQTLAEGGNAELLYQMNNRTDVPGYGYQIMNGATALAEHWSGPTADFLSQNHMIFGHLMEWFYTGLAGIKQQEGDPGYKKIIIDPELKGHDLTWVKSSYKSVNGMITVFWQKTKSNFTLEVIIPTNSTADVVLPVSSVDELKVNGKSFVNVREIKQVTKRDGRLTLEIPSGKYRFICKTIE